MFVLMLAWSQQQKKAGSTEGDAKTKADIPSLDSDSEEEDCKDKLGVCFANDASPGMIDNEAEDGEDASGCDAGGMDPGRA